MLKKLLFILYLLPLFIPAQNFPSQPDDYVTDRARLLSSAEQQVFNTRLKYYETKTSTQFFIYIAESLNGADISQLCQQIFHTWQIGSEQNNGVLIAIFVSDHKFRIHTGYGLEGALPDLATKHIQDEIMQPQFKSGNYYAGLDAGIKALIEKAGNEYEAPEPEKETDYGMLICYIVNGILFIFYIYLAIKQWPDKKVTRLVTIAIAFLAALIPVIGALILFIMITFIWPESWRRRDSGALAALGTVADVIDVISDFSSTGSGSKSGGGSGRSSNSGSSSDSSSDSGFDGGGGGDSGGGGSDSRW